MSSVEIINQKRLGIKPRHELLTMVANQVDETFQRHDHVNTRIRYSLEYINRNETGGSAEAKTDSGECHLFLSC